MSSTKNLIIVAVVVVAAAGIIISLMDSDKSIQETVTQDWNNVHENVYTSFSEIVVLPEIESEAFIHPFAVVIGNCYIGKMVFVAPTAVCRGDEGTPIHISDYSNLQDGAVLHALKTSDKGNNIDGMKFSSDGDRLDGSDPRFAESYAIWIGERVSLAHGSQVHGPAWVGDDTFIGMGVTDPLLQCQSGFVYLRNPSTGAIICQGELGFQRFVDRGWRALDGPPPKKETKLDQCNGGEIHIQSPILGTILCKFPPDAQKFIDRGWEALDDLPTFTQTGAGQCNATRVAMSGDITGTVSCIRFQSVDFFKSQGFTLIEEEPKTDDPIMYEMTVCRGSNTFHLQNPSSGVIMCAEQSNVPKYLNRGWVALDELPFNVP